jgi:hypothetical protein
LEQDRDARGGWILADVQVGTGVCHTGAPVVTRIFRQCWQSLARSARRRCFCVIDHWNICTLGSDKRGQASKESKPQRVAKCNPRPAGMWHVSCMNT